MSPPPWGCSPPCPGLALAGRAGSGGGSHWRGCFPLRGHVGTLSPPRSVQLCLHSAVGGPGGLAVPTQGGSRWAACCILHVWGCLGVGLGAGGAAVTIPAPNFGEGDPNLPGTSGGSWEWSKTGGKHSPASAQSPSHLVPPGQLRVPPRVPGDLLLQSGGQWGPPTALAGVCTPTGSAFVWGAGTSAPLCGPGGDRSLCLGPGQPLPCDPLPSRSCSPSQGLCWGQGWLHPLRCPPHGCLTPPLAMCPGGELCLSPHPAAVARPLAGTHKLWCSRLRIHYCFQTAAKGWAGGVPQSPGHLKTLRAPHCMGTPVWSLLLWLWGWGGLAPGACQAGLRVPRGLRTGLWAPKTTGDHPKLPGGGTASWGCGGSCLSPFSCGRGAAIWGPRGVTGLGGLRPCPVAPPGRCPHPPPVFVRVPPRGGAEPL